MSSTINICNIENRNFKYDDSILDKDVYYCYNKRLIVLHWPFDKTKSYNSFTPT